MRGNEGELTRKQYIIIFTYVKFCGIENNSISAIRMYYSVHAFILRSFHNMICLLNVSPPFFFL